MRFIFCLITFKKTNIFEVKMLMEMSGMSGIGIGVFQPLPVIDLCCDFMLQFV